jgi:glycosyltransferase involved in cell wall biosynthesis
LDKGDKLRAYHQIKQLSGIHNIHLFCTSDEAVTEESRDELLKYCSSVKVYRLNKIQILLSLIQGVFSKLPFQTHYFKVPVLRRELAQIIQEKNITVCYVQLLRLHLNIPYGMTCKYYLDYMDAFSLGMIKRADRTSFPFNLLVKSEVRRLQRLENRVSYYYHGASIISRRDASALEGQLPYEIDIVPNGIDSSFCPSPSTEKDIDIVFVGNMGYYPNIRAVEYIVQEVMPTVWKKEPKAKFYIVGTDPAESVNELQNDRVIVTGRVPSVTEYLNRSKLFLAPMFAGQGMQNKILEAMACEVPVVTTSLAAGAFEGVDESGIQIGDNAIEIASNVLKLLERESFRKELGLQGRKFIENGYRWEDSMMSLSKKFEEL